MNTIDYAAFISNRCKPIDNFEFTMVSIEGRCVAHFDEAFGKVGYPVPRAVAGHEIYVSIPIPAGTLRRLPDSSPALSSVLSGDEGCAKREGFQIECQ